MVTMTPAQPAPSVDGEREQSRRLADRILDRPNGDPDDDLAVLSRQLLRADERATKAETSIEEMRKAAAVLLKAPDPETWPFHGNAPLAITASLAFEIRRREALESFVRRFLAVDSGFDNQRIASERTELKAEARAFLERGE